MHGDFLFSLYLTFTPKSALYLYIYKATMHKLKILTMHRWRSGRFSAIIRIKETPMAYGSDAGLTSYLSLTGRTLPTGVVPAVAREWGSKYVNLWEDRYKGSAIAPPDSFPRDIYNPVPVAVEYATYEAAFAWSDGVNLFGSGGTAGGQVIRKKVDVMEIAYAEPQAGSGGWWDNNRFILPLAYNYLLPYMKSGLGGAAAFVVGHC